MDIRRGVGAGSLALVTLLVGSLAAAGGVDPTAESVATASLLQTEDVPEEASSLGVEDASADDLPAFADNGGLREVRQTWFSMDPVRVIYDFRFQFPDAPSAKAFLDASADLLGEVATGGVQLPPPVRPLPDTRFYYFLDTRLGTDTVGYNFLMRHENIVAKVYVSGLDADVSEDMASDIARAAADRMIAALGGSAEPSAAPPSGPAASPDTVDPVALAELVGHIPAAISGSCEPEPYPPGAPEQGGELVRVVCTPSDLASVQFQLFDEVAAMDAAYDTAHEYAQVFGSRTVADSCAEGSFDGTWTVSGKEAGRLLCYDLVGTASVVWSHPATRILSTIAQRDGDVAAAWDLWLASGPE